MIDGTTLGVALGLLQISNRKNTERIVSAILAQQEPRRKTCAELAKEQYEAESRAATAARIRECCERQAARQEAARLEAEAELEGAPTLVTDISQMPEPPPLILDQDDDDDDSGSI